MNLNGKYLQFDIVSFCTHILCVAVESSLFQLDLIGIRNCREWVVSHMANMSWGTELISHFLHSP